MRIIPGNTKVKIEIFRGVGLWDLLVGALAAIMLALIVVSTLPFKLVFVTIHILISVVLLARFDKEPNYLYLIHVLRHFGFRRRFERVDTDEILADTKERGVESVVFDEVFPEEKEREELFEEEEETP